MIATDPLSFAYADFLTGQYDFVDRIILNAYFPLFHGPCRRTQLAKNRRHLAFARR
jgi:hypothetical protein